MKCQVSSKGQPCGAYSGGRSERFAEEEPGSTEWDRRKGLFGTQLRISWNSRSGAPSSRYALSAQRAAEEDRVHPERLREPVSLLALTALVYVVARISSVISDRFMLISYRNGLAVLRSPGHSSGAGVHCAHTQEPGSANISRDDSIMSSVGESFSSVLGFSQESQNHLSAASRSYHFSLLQVN